jgi:DNA-binding transcriptional ArsR family regulator
MGEDDVDDDQHSTAIQRVQDELLGETLDLDREVSRMGAIGENTRFVILYLLTSDGELTSGDLADLLDRHQNDLYHHLNTLEHAGLVGKYREDGDRVYELSPLAEDVVPTIFESIERRASSG